MAHTIFISYGHADMMETPWIERLRLYLEQNRHKNGVMTWDDSKIEPGSDWRFGEGCRTALENQEYARI